MKRGRERERERDEMRARMPQNLFRGGWAGAIPRTKEDFEKTQK